MKGKPARVTDEEDKEWLRREVSRVVLQLRLHSPFFAALVMFARIIETKRFDTAATDGRDIFINVGFWRGLSKDERLGVMLHEVLHAALLHVTRRGTRDPLLWNIAADIVVNGQVLTQQACALPKGHLREPDLEHLSVEEVYHYLQEHPEHKYSLKLVDLIWTQDGLDMEGLSQHWRNAIQQARAIAQMAGHGDMPAGMGRELTSLDPARLDWRSYLWRFLVRTPNDFQGFDRRFVGAGLYLEALEGETVRVYVAVDTSGSIGGREMQSFVSEVVGIVQAYPHLEAQLYYADAACYGPYELQTGGEIPRPIGGGGTDFRPFFTQVAEAHKSHDTGVCVYLTDGYGIFPEQEPELPTLWVIAPGGIGIDAVPFGEGVRLI